MPKLNNLWLKKELNQGKIWPVYYIAGEESFLARKAVEAIEDLCRKTFGYGFKTVDGDKIEIGEVLEEAKMLEFGRPVQLLRVTSAEKIKNLESIATELKPQCAITDAEFVIILISKDLDQRRKSTKVLLDKAGVVVCETPHDSEREAFLDGMILDYMKAYNPPIHISDHVRYRFLTNEPFSLSVIENELSKLAFARTKAEQDELLSSEGSFKQDEFIEALFSRKRVDLFRYDYREFDNPSVGLPLLGLLSYNARQLMAYKLGASPLPFLRDRLARWGKVWSITDCERLTHSLFQVDFETKQTRKLGLATWHRLVDECAIY